MMRPSRLGVAFIIPTSMYVETSVNTAERCCEGSLLGEKSVASNGDQTSGHKNA